MWPRTQTFTEFDNPVTRGLEGGDFNPTLQRITLTKPLHAIAIASDSLVDACDVWTTPKGGASVEHRIRVCPGRPWVGKIDPVADGIDSLYVVPVRAFAPPPAGAILPVPAEQYPTLRLALYDCPPAWMPTCRAPLSASWTGAAVTPGPPTPRTQAYIPTAGRASVVIGVDVELDTASAVDAVFYGVNYAWSSAGVVEEIVTTLASLSLGSGDESYAYEGSPFEVMGVTLECVGGTANLAVKFQAHGDL